MEYKISDNMLPYIKKAFLYLLENNERVFLEKPFGGFFISFDDKQPVGTLMRKYSAQEIGIENCERAIYLFCKDIM